MPREIVMGNGRFLVALDEKMGVRDFFYPRVGLENHAMGHVFRFGVRLVSQCFAKNSRLGVELEVNDAIHSVLGMARNLTLLTVQFYMDQQRSPLRVYSPIVRDGFVFIDV